MAHVREGHQLIRGVDEVVRRYQTNCRRDGMFNDIFDLIRENWLKYRQAGRVPSAKNWIFRVARDFTQHPTKYIEKQLQKEIAICMEADGWGNDMPTASGLVNSRSRQMNIDLVRKLPDGFELFEVKVASDNPYEAAAQILRYTAIFRLYRTEPELLALFRENPVLSARRIDLKVLAPSSYYAYDEVDLPTLEGQLNEQVHRWGESEIVPIRVTFAFQAFPSDFEYRPGMDCSTLQAAVIKRCSPFRLNLHEPSKESAIEQGNP